MLIIALAILSIILVRYLIVTRNYVSLNATIKEITIDTDTQNDPSANSSTTRNYVTYAYQVKGKDYTADQQILFTSGYKIGMEKKIKYNPEKPEEIFNTLLVKVCLSSMGFIALFMFGLSKSKKA